MINLNIIKSAMNKPVSHPLWVVCCWYIISLLTIIGFVLSRIQG